MTRMTFAFRHQKGLHQLFLISVWIKGLSGILETLAGIVAIFVEPRALESVVLFLTATELSEDPDDWFAKFLGGAVHQYSVDTQTFLSVYLISHGLIRVFLVAGRCDLQTPCSGDAARRLAVSFVSPNKYRLPV